jgi:hypothetical protein
LDRIPDVGQEATVAGRTLRVEARDGHRVAMLRLLPAEPAPPDGPGAVAGPAVPAGLLALLVDGPLALASAHSTAAVAALRALL